MCKSVYIVNCASGNEFRIEQPKNNLSIIIDQWHIYPYQPHPEKSAYTDLANLHKLLNCLMALGAENDTILSVFITVLLMVNCAVYSVNVKE